MINHRRESARGLQLPHMRARGPGANPPNRTATRTSESGCDVEKGALTGEQLLREIGHEVCAELMELDRSRQLP